jgi:hypothetical protein
MKGDMANQEEDSSFATPVATSFALGGRSAKLLAVIDEKKYGYVPPYRSDNASYCYSGACWLRTRYHGTHEL